MSEADECNMAVKQNTWGREGAALFPCNLNLKVKHHWDTSTLTGSAFSTLTVAMHIVKFLTSQTYQGQTYHVSNLYSYTV